MLSTTGTNQDIGYDTFVPDCVSFPKQASAARRMAMLVASAAAGGIAAYALTSGGQAPVMATLLTVAFAGGLLSTWSPCGYSSISLLRQTGKGAGAVARFLPTFLVHGLGYAAGAVVLGLILGAIGAVLGFSGIGVYALAALALMALAYGAHQFDLLPMPYPQRRAQVPHDARNRFPKWVVSAIYGFSLGLDYLTYVQTPLLYITTAAAIFTGNVGAAIALIAVFNLGRYLPVAVNLLPWKDYQIQAWLARYQQAAAHTDGAILAALGAALAVFALNLAL